MVLGPAGAVVLGLEVDSPIEGLFRTDPAWGLDPPPPPIDAYIWLVSQLVPIVGSCSLRCGKFAFSYQETFLPVDRELLTGAELHIKIHPLSHHVILPLCPE